MRLSVVKYEACLGDPDKKHAQPERRATNCGELLTSSNPHRNFKYLITQLPLLYPPDSRTHPSCAAIFSTACPFVLSYSTYHTTSDRAFKNHSSSPEPTPFFPHPPPSESKRPLDSHSITNHKPAIQNSQTSNSGAGHPSLGHVCASIVCNSAGSQWTYMP